MTPNTPPRTPGLEDRAEEIAQTYFEAINDAPSGVDALVFAGRRLIEKYPALAPAERGGRYREALEAITESPAGEADDSWEMRAIACRALTPEQGERTDAPAWDDRCHTCGLRTCYGDCIPDEDEADAPPAPGETREDPSDYLCGVADEIQGALGIGGPEGAAVFGILERRLLDRMGAAPTSEAARLADRLENLAKSHALKFYSEDRDDLRAAARLLRGER